MVLKARYFPNTNFLHAELGTKPSYAWRSILLAQPVLKADYRWQVGDGNNIGIWTKRRLPRPSTFRVLSRLAILPADTKVSSLIDSDSGEWSVNLINQIFSSDDVTSIIVILLSHHKPRDRLILAYTPKGK